MTASLIGVPAFNRKPFNPALAGVNGFRSPEPESKPARIEPAPEPIIQPDLPFEPALPPPSPPKRRRSREQGRRIRAAAAQLGRSTTYVRQLLKVLETGDFDVIARLATGQLSVNRAVAMIDPQVARDRELANRFNAAPQHLREMLVSLLDS